MLVRSEYFMLYIFSGTLNVLMMSDNSMMSSCFHGLATNGSGS